MKESFETGFCGHARQQGAATLMAVLFLLIVIAFAVLVATSMSGSDITDTSLGQSGVSALLLAESGIERAAARYVAGSACTSLAVDGPYTLGQGSFTINASYTTDFSGATLPAGECRVQSVGTVGLAQRTVQAILQLPASDGMVVGSGGTVLRCGGSTCTSANQGIPGTDNLVGVSCPTSTDCISVAGNNGDAFNWNGSTWTQMPPPAIPQWQSFASVACAPGNGTDCFAVGTAGAGDQYVLQWTGAAWRTVGAYPGWYDAYFGQLNAISCAGSGAATTCYATTNGGWFGSIFWVGPTRTGGNWYLANSSNSLAAVSCATVTGCWATESSGGGNQRYFDPLTSSGPGREVRLRVSGNASFDAISCDMTTDCWATGTGTGKSSRFEYFSGGTNWSAQSSRIKLNDLYGIDCLSATDCWAVGANGTVLSGSSAGMARIWTPVASGTTSRLNSVSFPAAGAGGSGSAAVVRWHEIES